MLYEVITILNLSAKNSEALKELADKYVDFLKNDASASEYKYSLGDICYTANTGRHHFNYRLSVCSNNINGFTKKLEEYIQEGSATGVQTRNNFV